MSDNGGSKPPSTAEQKVLHNELERRRRENIKENFDDIKKLVPGIPTDKPPSTILVLSKAKEYIDQLTRTGFALEVKKQALLKRNHDALLKSSGVAEDLSDEGGESASAAIFDQQKNSLNSFKEKVNKQYIEEVGGDKKQKRTSKKAASNAGKSSQGTSSSTTSQKKAQAASNSTGKDLTNKKTKHVLADPETGETAGGIVGGLSNLDEMIKRASAQVSEQKAAGKALPQQLKTTKKGKKKQQQQQQEAISRASASPKKMGKSPSKYDSPRLLPMYANTLSPRKLRMKTLSESSNMSGISLISEDAYPKKMTAEESLEMVNQMNRYPSSSKRIQPAEIVPNIPLTSSHHQKTRGLRLQSHPYLATSSPHNPRLLRSARGPNRHLKSFTEAEIGFEDSKEEYYTKGRTRKDSQKVVEESLREHHEKITRSKNSFMNRKESLPSKYAGAIAEEGDHDLMFADYDPDAEVFY
eukprot:Nk52_evm9s2622 gene=Nk52_evmTU9s2622